MLTFANNLGVALLFMYSWRFFFFYDYNWHICADISLIPVNSSTLTPMHLRKAKLMFFWVRYPSSAVLKMYFPDIKFNKNNTAQLVKWFSNFRWVLLCFFYIFFNCIQLAETERTIAILRLSHLHIVGRKHAENNFVSPPRAHTEKAVCTIFAGRLVVHAKHMWPRCLLAAKCKLPRHNKAVFHGGHLSACACVHGFICE